MFRKNKNKNGGDLILYINDGIPGKLINSYDFKEGSEIMIFEFIISNKKWLLLENYKQPSQNRLSFINKIKLSLKFFNSSYDLNLSTENPNFKNLLNSFNLENLIKISTCYKLLSSPTCIHLILTNKKALFMKSTAFETGMSYFDKLTPNILRKAKRKRQKIFYRDYKAFHHNIFETRLQPKLTSETIINYSPFQSRDDTHMMSMKTVQFL